MGLDANVIGQCTQVSARSAEDCGAVQSTELPASALAPAAHASMLQHTARAPASRQQVQVSTSARSTSGSGTCSIFALRWLALVFSRHSRLFLSPFLVRAITAEA